MAKYELQAVIIKKSFSPTRESAWRIARHFIRRLYRYKPGSAFHHFERKDPQRFRWIRTWNARKLKAVKFKYGPLGSKGVW
jgi:hypothetical protein